MPCREPMKVDASRRSLLCLTMVLSAVTALADSSKPTCDEKPGARDCVRLEDPNATPPRPTVDQKKPVQLPVVRPLPSGGAGTGGVSRGK